MADITDDVIKKVALMSRLKLTPEQIKKYSKEVSEILKYVEMLNEVDTDGVEETAQVTGLKNVLREDEVNSEFCSREELLETTDLPVQDSQIRVKSVFD